MKIIERNLFWIVVCVSLLFVQISFIIFEVNIYNYLFWPYVFTSCGIVILAVIVFYRFDTLMCKLGPDIIISKYKKVLKTPYFILLFLLFTFLICIDIYTFGQLFIPEEIMSHFITGSNPLIGWLICFLFTLFLTIVVSIPMRAIIKEKIAD